MSFDMQSKCRNYLKRDKNDKLQNYSIPYYDSNYFDKSNFSSSNVSPGSYEIYYSNDFDFGYGACFVEKDGTFEYGYVIAHNGSIRIDVKQGEQLNLYNCRSKKCFSPRFNKATIRIAVSLILFAVTCILVFGFSELKEVFDAYSATHIGIKLVLSSIVIFSIFCLGVFKIIEILLPDRKTYSKYKIEDEREDYYKLGYRDAKIDNIIQEEERNN